MKLMAVYVEHKETGDFFIYLGGGFGVFQSETQTMLPVKRGSFHLVALCDKNGDIGWVKSDKIKVIHIDGVELSEMNDLGEFNLKNTD